MKYRITGIRGPGRRELRTRSNGEVFETPDWNEAVELADRIKRYDLMREPLIKTIM